MAVAVDMVELLTAKFSVLLPHLEVRQRRLYLGSQARSLGYGGIAAVARAGGVSRQTVMSGVAELEFGQTPSHRVRRVGGGRKRLAELDAGLRPALLALVEPDECGRCHRCGGRRNRSEGWPPNSLGSVTGSPRTRWLICCGRRVSACRPMPRP